MSDLTEMLRASFCRWVKIYRGMDEFRHVIETDFDWALYAAPKGTLWAIPVIGGLSIKRFSLFLKGHRPGWIVDRPSILELFDGEDLPDMHVLFITRFYSNGTILGFRKWSGERAAERVDRLSPLEGFLFACDRWPVVARLRCVATYQEKQIPFLIELAGNRLFFRHEGGEE